MSPELQTRFAAAVRYGDPLAQGAVLAASATSKALTQAALHLHASTTRDSLTAALRDSFPTVVRRLSKRRFAALAADYIRLSPPRRATLWAWGDDFADFLATRGASPTVADLARLDRAWLDAFAAAEAPAMTAQELSARPRDSLAGLHLDLHPSGRLLALSSDGYADWRTAAAAPLGKSIAETASDGRRILLARPQAHVRALSLAPGGFRFAAALAGGAALLDAVGVAAASDDRFDLQSTLSQLLSAGAIRSLSPEKGLSDD